MPVLHVDKLRSGEGSVDEYRVAETRGLPPWGAEADAGFGVVGRAIPRVEGEEKVTGRARYAYDIRLPGQLYARVLRSPLPHARIRRIDTSRAEALPGVRAVLSAANAPEVDWYDDSFVFDRHLRFVGDEVAAVAADSEEIADDALRLIEVDYEPLPFVLDVAAALAPGAPLLHEASAQNGEEEGSDEGEESDEGGGEEDADDEDEATIEPGSNRVGKPKTYARGDVEAGLRSADVVIEHTYATQTALHNAMEPHGTTATWEGDHLTLWDSTQSIFDVRQEVAEKLELPENHVRVVKQYMGGGFGAKQVAWKNAVLAALLSQASGRPVQLMLDREAENLAAGNRSPTRQRLRLGAKRNGTLTAIDARIELAVGAHMVGGEASNVAGIYQALYRCANVRTEQVAVYVNLGPSVAFRAPGFVEAAFALETAMDELARELKLDPVELRRRNYAETDQSSGKPYSVPESLRRCYEAVTEAFGWNEERPEATQPNGAKRRGVGFAAHSWVGGAGYPPGYAWVKLNADGTADVVTGTQDIGTGSRTALTQVAAEELGLPVERVALHLGDTANGPYAPVSSGSSTLATIGPAVRGAAADAKRQLLEAAGTFLEETPERLSVRDGQVWVEGDARPAAAVEEVTARVAPHMILGQGARGPNPDDKAIRTFGAQCAEVEVDSETGEVTVLRIAAAHDCGRIVNPTLVESQVVGGVTQGIGFALTEARVVDAESGIVLNADLEEYKLPTVADVPPIAHAAVDLPDPIANALGAKGIGEPPIIPTAPAIANAVYDAVGVRIYETPLSRRRMLEALAGARGREPAGGTR